MDKDTATAIERIMRYEKELMNERISIMKKLGVFNWEDAVALAISFLIGGK